MDESANAPLISHQDTEEHHDTESIPDAERQVHDGGIGAFLWLLVLSAGISGLLFGCEFSRMALGSGASITDLVQR